MSTAVATAGTLGRSLRRTVPAALVLLSPLALWQAARLADVVSESALPAPLATLERLVALLGTTDTWVAIGQTLLGWGISLAAAIAIAVPLGITLGLSRFWRGSTLFPVEFLRTVPPLAYIPLAAILFNTDRNAELLLVIPACCWPLLVHTVEGVRDVDPLMLETARSYRLGRHRRIVGVVLPSSLPFLGTGLRIAATTGMLLAIGAELLLGVPGLGAQLARAQAGAAVTDVYAYTIIAALLGLAVTLAFDRVERRIGGWHPSRRLDGPR